MLRDKLVNEAQNHQKLLYASDVQPAVSNHSTAASGFHTTKLTIVTMTSFICTHILSNV
jgi:hypothetical protein